MMATVRFGVVGTPAPQGSKRGFVNRHSGKVSMVESSSERVKTWRADVREEAMKRKDDGWATTSGPVSVDIVFFLARPKGHYGSGRNATTLKPSAPPYPANKPDLDKLERGTLDALTGVIFTDDCQVVDLASHKRYSSHDQPAGAIIDVTVL